MAASKSYEDGLLEGEVKGLHKTVEKHGARMDSHSRRIVKLERVAWIILGIVVAIEALPKAQEALNVMSGG